MKLFKTLTFAAAIFSVFSISANPVSKAVIYQQTPDRTVTIKSASTDANVIFSAGMIGFEVYKAGSAQEVNALLKKLKENKEVSEAVAGKVTGDYTQITVSLKSVKDKAFWAGLLKSAGLNNIKINKNPVTEIDKI
jgi:hypothetical protein